MIVADRNESADAVAFRAAPDGLSQIMKELVYAKHWTHDDPIAEQMHGQIVCAEVLVPNLVPADRIDGVYASCAESAQKIHDAIGDALAITVNREVFFQ